ncbi:hypothetical protein LGK97_08485 [Clostridium sp. CS001]|uniref:LolA family protein n=1 Tax=Clostridium sp. CS001 TaxID=2880648 RepID=UPI001CF42113|nr:sigma-E factor regulatory protein RseB domain-containing protein [Clostridium sp. CS001]MCB2289801.1 hypothetical protein [Clostridium sp. CS001]
MSFNEKELSYYIDSLNDEKKPKEHDNEISSKKFILSLGSIAAVLAIFFTANMVLPIGKNNIVYAMTKAYNEMKTYHGIIQIVTINNAGNEEMQGKIEAWSDKSGQYYVKELEGFQKGLVTVNNGKQKWQVQPTEKEVDIFPVFPDLYRFAFEIGKEIDQIKSAVSTKVVGDETIAGRLTTILEVTPQGGSTYKIWIDKESKMPLQKQSSITNSTQYKISYASIDFKDAIPKELMVYNLPEGFKEVNTSPEQLVTNIEEAKGIVDFMPKLPQEIPNGYNKGIISVVTNDQTVKTSYTSTDEKKTIILLQGKSKGKLVPVYSAILGKVDNNIAEIQYPMESTSRVLGGGMYDSMTNINSIRWQQDGLEFTMLGDTTLTELATFIKATTNSTVELPKDEALIKAPKVKVPYDLETERNDQKSIDAGHSPWRLDPVFVSQVFVSLKISPQGIVGDYPIKEEDLKLIEKNDKEAIVEVSGSKTPITKVYLERLVRQDSTGIWTVVGYDPK